MSMYMKASPVRTDVTHALPERKRVSYPLVRHVSLGLGGVQVFRYSSSKFIKKITTNIPRLTKTLFFTG